MGNIDLFPLLLSLKVSFLATLLSLLFGIPIAWVLARLQFPGKKVIDSFITLPIFLPPSVLGYYLLIFIGKKSFIGQTLDFHFGLNLIFTWPAAVIAALLVAMPLLIKSVKTAFEGIDKDIEDAARTLGKSEWQIFLTVTLPLGWRGLLTGTVLAFARAIGDFGTTLMVVGNIPQKTQTMPIAIYDAVLSGNTSLANTLVLVMTVVALSVLLILYKFGESVPGGHDDA